MTMIMEGGFAPVLAHVLRPRKARFALVIFSERVPSRSQSSNFRLKDGKISHAKPRLGLRAIAENLSFTCRCKTSLRDVAERRPSGPRAKAFSLSDEVLRVGEYSTRQEEGSCAKSC